MATCVFCNIIQEKTDTQFLYRENKVVVFKDINPQAPVHLLIVPERHIRSINDIKASDRDILGEMMMVAKKMAQAQRIDQSGYRLFFNVEKGGGQMIFHLHLHLIGGWQR